MTSVGSLGRQPGVPTTMSPGAMGFFFVKVSSICHSSFSQPTCPRRPFESSRTAVMSLTQTSRNVMTSLSVSDIDGLRVLEAVGGVCAGLTHPAPDHPESGPMLRDDQAVPVNAVDHVLTVSRLDIPCPAQRDLQIEDGRAVVHGIWVAVLGDLPGAVAAPQTHVLVAQSPIDLLYRSLGHGDVVSAWTPDPDLTAVPHLADRRDGAFSAEVAGRHLASGEDGLVLRRELGSRLPLLLAEESAVDPEVVGDHVQIPGIVEDLLLSHRLLRLRLFLEGRHDTGHGCAPILS